MISDQLKKIGITDPLEIIYNPSFDKLYEEETLSELTGYEKSQKTEYGALNAVSYTHLTLPTTSRV